MKKHGILFKSVPDQWLINLGDGGYMEVAAGVGFIEAMDEVSNMGWEVVSVFGVEEALVTMDYKEYKR